MSTRKELRKYKRERMRKKVFVTVYSVGIAFLVVGRAVNEVFTKENIEQYEAMAENNIDGYRLISKKVDKEYSHSYQKYIYEFSNGDTNLTLYSDSQSMYKNLDENKLFKISYDNNNVISRIIMY